MYEMGERFQPTLVEMVDGETSPPQLLTEADLISLMEKHGIGKPINPTVTVFLSKNIAVSLFCVWHDPFRE